MKKFRGPRAGTLIVASLLLVLALAAWAVFWPAPVPKALTAHSADAPRTLPAWRSQA